LDSPTFQTRSSYWVIGPNIKLSLLFCLVLFIIGCASSPEINQFIEANSDDLDKKYLIDSVAFYPQDQYQCGPAALAILLTHSNLSITPEELVDSVYVPDLKGSLQIEILAATRQRGRLAYELEPALKSLFKEVSSGHPVLVLQNLGFKVFPKWHYAVVIGYDLENQTVTLHSGTKENYSMRLATFERTWRQADNWAMIAVQPGITTLTMDANSYFESAVAFERVNLPSATESVYLAGTQRWVDHRLLNIALANFLYHQNRLKESIEVYQKVLQIYADDAITHNNLAQVLSEFGDIELAERHALIATELGGKYSDRFQETLEQIRNKKTDPNIM
jgi:tetratricopeptide (TPR) repeat protein